MARQVGIEARHAFRRNVIASAGLAYSVADFAGVSQVEKQTLANLGVEYFVNREVTLFSRTLRYFGPARTTLDVLNAQNDVISAKINLATSERDVVVASYAILSAMGRLSIDRLALQVTKYKPEEHYKAVKDKWTGLRTPDGR